MRWIVLANSELKEEFLSRGIHNDVRIEWIRQAEEFSNFPDADVYFDLLFINQPERIKILSDRLPAPVLISSVIHPLHEMDFPFIRINAWPTFLKRGLLEAASPQTDSQVAAEQIAKLINRETEWVPDISGFVTARVIAMIINEAYFALQENVSTKTEIDKAMKLGTNYPYGPFEWAEKIGVKNIADLLTILSRTDKKYQPAESLLQEATN